MTEKWSRAVLRGLGSRKAPRLPDHIQQFPVGKTHSAKRHDGVLLGFKTIITPSASAVKRHQQALKEVIERHQALPQAVLIKHLNPLIRGWASYSASVCAKRCYTQMDTYLFQRLWHWSKRRHPNKSGTWRARTYWHPEKGGWRFATKTGSLHLHRMTPIKRHVKVQGRKSPFDGDWVYWTQRQGSHPQTPPKMAYLLKKQGGRLFISDHLLGCSFGFAFFFQSVAVTADVDDGGAMQESVQGGGSLCLPERIRGIRTSPARGDGGGRSYGRVQSHVTP